MPADGFPPGQRNGTRVLYFLSVICLIVVGIYSAVHRPQPPSRPPPAAASSSARRAGPAAFNVGNKAQRLSNAVGAFDESDAGLQHRELWGPLPNGTGAAVRVWIRFLCADGELLARGFAVGEVTTSPPKIEWDVPVVADAIQQNLPQLELILTNGTTVNMTQLFTDYWHRSRMNTWHFEVSLPWTAIPRALGVRGWSHLADLHLPRGQCRGPAEAAAELPWRKPGTIWTVVSSARPVHPELHAYTTLSYLKWHLQLGLSGLIMITDNWETPELLCNKSAALKQAVDAGKLHFYVWTGARVTGERYYQQSQMYNAVLLSAWGTGVHLMMADLDEWLVLPGKQTLQGALAPGGCLSGTAQAKIARHDVVSTAWADSQKGDVFHWRTTKDGDCHAWLQNYTDIGLPANWGVPWKSLINPDRIGMYHTHHGMVLNNSYVSATSKMLTPHTQGNSQGPERTLPKYECAYFMHIVNMFRRRRTVEDVAEELRSSGDWKDVQHMVASCQKRAAATRA